MKGLPAIARLAFVVAGAVAGAAAAEDAQFPAIGDAGGCDLRQVTKAADGETHFQFEGASHDGRRLILGWEKGDAHGAYVLDLANGERREVAGLNNAGVFSVDDARILIANTIADGTTEILEYELASGYASPIAPHPKHDFLATYSPDGRWILFNSYRSGQSDIYRIRRDGGEPERLTEFEGYEAHAAFAPGMKTILFHRDVGGGDYDIYQIDPETRVATPFIAGPGEQSYPSWSPDGHFVAFASDAGEDAGKTDIYIADRRGGIVSRVTRHPGYNTYPSWSKDGRWLFFNAERAEKTRNVLRAEIDRSGHCRPARR